MATKKTQDQRANYACILVTESAANTLTFLKFNFPFSIMDKMALNICRIEYTVDASQLNSTADQVCVALTMGSTIANILVQSDPLLIDSHRIIRRDFGAAASGILEVTPFIKDFSTLPGGGLLVAPNPLCAAIQAAGAAAACSAYVKLFYTYRELETDEYWELVESRRVIGV